jgi:hypothetical protein
VTLWEKLLRNCVKTPSGCWRWQGATDQDGYALVRVGKQVRRGHEVMWEIHNGRRIPPGYQPDHTCKLTGCINPSHLELVTCGENKKRAWLYQKRATHCPKGHAMTAANTYRRPGRKYRTCRKCRELSRTERSKPLGLFT